MGKETTWVIGEFGEGDEDFGDITSCCLCSSVLVSFCRAKLIAFNC